MGMEGIQWECGGNGNYTGKQEWEWMEFSGNGMNSMGMEMGIQWEREEFKGRAPKNPTSTKFPNNSPFAQQTPAIPWDLWEFFCPWEVPKKPGKSGVKNPLPKGSGEAAEKPQKIPFFLHFHGILSRSHSDPGQNS